MHFAAGGCGISRKVYPRARHPCGYSRKTNLGRFYAVAWKSTNPDTKPAQINNGQEASAVVGVVHSVNDPDTLLKDFIHKHITRPALTNDAMPEQDRV